MTKIQRNFAKGRMNKSIDERLLPNGEYTDALNVRLGSTEQSEIGSVEVSKGNSQLSTLKFPQTTVVNVAPIPNVSPQNISSDAVCLGSYADEPNETIYWFLHDPSWSGIIASSITGSLPTCDMIVSYNTVSDVVNYHVISIWDGQGTTSTTYQTTLNFQPDRLITGINKIGDLLFFTDDFNPPRFINVTKNYLYPGNLSAAISATNPVDQFTAEEIMVIKKPPTESPILELSSTAVDDGYLHDRFICFAYRYRYEDKEYSATSQFSSPAFIPEPFSVSGDTALNDGMLNSISTVTVKFNTGGPLVKEIEILFKEADDATIRIIQNFNKEKEGYANNEIQQLTFDTSKIFSVLPEYEILRLYDNVPRKAKAQTIMGNRLMYGNYIENYNLIDKDGFPVNIDFSVGQVNEDVGVENLTTTLSSNTYNTENVPATLVPSSVLNIDFTDATFPIPAGTVLSIEFNLVHHSFVNSTPAPTAQPTQVSAVTDISFTYTLPTSISSVLDLANSVQFQQSIGIGPASALGTAGTIQTVQNCGNGVTLTDLINCGYNNSLGGGNPDPLLKYVSGATLQAGDTPLQGQGITIGTSGSNILTLTLNPMIYVDNVTTPTVRMCEFSQAQSLFASLITTLSSKSLHSNRGYDIGIIYMDEFNRATTALTSKLNNVFIECEQSTTINKIEVQIPQSQKAPFWATSYKFAIKPTNTTYNTIFSRKGFKSTEDGSFYFLLEGENSKKVEVGDKLIIKRDINGPLFSCEYNAVLDKGAQPANFIKALNPFFNPDESVTDEADNPGQGSNPEFEFVPAGVYMQMRDLNFSALSLVNNSNLYPTTCFSTKQEKIHNPPPQDCANLTYRGLSGDPQNADCNNPDAFTPFNIPSGSRINLKIKCRVNGSTFLWGAGSACNERKYIYNKTFISDASYTDIIDFWEGMNIASTLNDAEENINEQSEGPITCDYITPVVEDATQDYQIDEGCGNLKIRVQWGRNSTTNEIYFFAKSFKSCGGGGLNNNTQVKLTVEWKIDLASESIVFETEPEDALPNLWYESDAAYPIDVATGNHLGSYASNPAFPTVLRYPNNQNQNISTGVSGIIKTTFFNCFCFGNGVESYRIEDSIVGKTFTLGNRVTSTIIDEYKEADRFADITYSGIYQDETNINKLNEFNLGLANFKILDDTFGAVQILDGRKTDVLVLQEDKISYVLQGKNLLTDAEGSGQLTSVPEVLANQIARTEEFGISNNPESYAVYGVNKYFIDEKRGAVLQLVGSSAQNEQLKIISDFGMRSWFRDAFNGTLTGYTTIGPNTQKLGGYDPYMDEYVISLNDTAIFAPLPIYKCGSELELTTNSQVNRQFNVDLENAIGTVNWELTVTQNTLFSVEWNGTIVASGIATSAASPVAITFNKNVANANLATVTLQNLVAGENTINLSPNCVIPNEVTIIQIVLANPTTGGLNYSFTDYSWSGGGFTSTDFGIGESQWYGEGTTPTAGITTESFPIVGWNSSTYSEGDSALPLDGSTVYMRFRDITFPVESGGPNQFPFNPNTNKFRYLQSATLYDPTPANIATILAASNTIATPYQLWNNQGSPAGWQNVVAGDPQNAQYRANFTYTAAPATPNLYLIWDLRTVTEDLLCFSPIVGGSLFDVCCQCSCGTGVCTKYRIVNNNSSQVVTYTYTNCSSVASSIDVFPASPTTPFVEYVL